MWKIPPTPIINFYPKDHATRLFHPPLLLFIMILPTTIIPATPSINSELESKMSEVFHEKRILACVTHLLHISVRQDNTGFSTKTFQTISWIVF